MGKLPKIAKNHFGSGKIVGKMGPSKKGDMFFWGKFEAFSAKGFFILSGLASTQKSEGPEGLASQSTKVYLQHNYFPHVKIPF